MKVRKIKSNWTGKFGYISLNTFLNDGLPFNCDFIGEWVEHTSLNKEERRGIIWR